MAFSKAFKITKDVRTFQAGESTGFALSLGSQYYDRKERTKKWTNYKAVVFAKGNQLGFYQQSLVQGTIIELSCDDLKIDMYNPEYPTIELVDARVGGIFTGDAPQQPQQNFAPQQQPQQHAQYSDPGFDPDLDIPF